MYLICVLSDFKSCLLGESEVLGWQGYTHCILGGQRCTFVGHFVEGEHCIYASLTGPEIIKLFSR